MQPVLTLLLLLQIHTCLCEYKSSESHSVFFDKYGNEYDDKKYFKLNNDKINDEDYNVDYKKDKKKKYEENEYENDKSEYRDGRKQYSRKYETYGEEREYDDFYDDDKKDYNKGGLYVGNPDDFGKIVRPCQNYDIYCIREFFAKHSYCKIARGPVPDPIYRAHNTLYIPKINASFIDTSVIINGLNGRVEEFYVDPVTDNLVIAIQFTNLRETINDTYFEFFRRAREPVMTFGSSGILFPSLTVTGVIPHINDLKLEKAEVHAYSDSAFPPFYLTPSAGESSDPQVQFAISEFLQNVPIVVQEVILTKSPFYFGSYIQYNICDFELKNF